MKIPVVRIGNSKGIRIPKPMLEHCKINDEVELEVEGNCILIKPLIQKPRQGWANEFKIMHKKRDDNLVIEDVLDDDLEGI